MTPVVDDAWQSVGLVPPQRLARLLQQSRSESGRTIQELSETTGIGPRRLELIESGSIDLDEAEVARLTAGYGLGSTSMIPDRSRLVVDLDEGLLRIDGRKAVTRVGDGVDREEVLARYVALVSSMRGISAGTKFELRDDDLDVLGKALRLGTSTVAADLEALMGDPRGLVRWRQNALRRKVLVPAAGILVSFCGAAALLMVTTPDGSAAAEEPTASTVVAGEVAPVVAPVEIGTAIMQERNPDGTPRPGHRARERPDTQRPNRRHRGVRERDARALSQLGAHPRAT